MVIDPKVLERIKKLHDHATSAKQIGSEAEALAFMEGVEKMLTKHGLSMSDVEFKLEQEQDPVGKERVSAERVGSRKKSRWTSWEWNIIRAVAKHHACEPIIAWRDAEVVLVGREINRRVAEFMMLTLITTANRLATKAYGERYKAAVLEGDVTAARGYRRSFLVAFSRRIADRYTDLADQSDLTAEERGVALVRLDSEKELTERYVSAMTGLSTKRTSAGAMSNLHGAVDGRKAAESVSLSAKGINSSGTTQQLLGGGR